MSTGQHRQTPPREFALVLLMAILLSPVALFWSTLRLLQHRRREWLAWLCLVVISAAVFLLLGSIVVRNGSFR